MKIFFRPALVTLLCLITASTALAGARVPTVGASAPAFTYRQLDGTMLRPSGLRGHPYMLWLVATWCPSCATGSAVVGGHIDMLARKGIRVVELRLAGDLGAPGPGLQSFQHAVGPKAFARNWDWAQASTAQTLALDPRGYPDIYYLIDRNGKVVTVSGNPAASWETIQKFADGIRTK